MGSGGGSGQQNSTSQVYNSNIPEYLQGPVQRMVGMGEALTDINKNPYRPFQGQGVGGTQIAGLSPLQMQALGGLGNMQPSAYTDQAAGLAGMAGTNQFTGENVNQFMSPYIEGVVNRQTQGAIRDYGRQLPGLASAAQKYGAMGGSRQALAQAEAQRGLYDKMADIEASGYQNAFQNAQQQFNTTNQNMLAAAQQLGGMGNQDYAQRMGINQAQMAGGAQEQGLMQNVYNQQYQNYQNAINYPYAQLSYLNGLIRGTSPASLGSSYQYQQYQAPISNANMLVGAGLSAAGLGSLGNQVAGRG